MRWYYSDVPSLIISKVIGTLIAILLLLPFVGCGDSTVDEAYKSAYENGARTARMGQPINSNPYGNWTSASIQWHNGWLDTKEKMQKEK
jgi:hypothetical protein